VKTAPLQKVALPPSLPPSSRGLIVVGTAVVVVSVTLGVLAHLACLGAPVYKAFLESTLASLALYAVPVIDRFAAKI